MNAVNKNQPMTSTKQKRVDAITSEITDPKGMCLLAALQREVTWQNEWHQLILCVK